MLPLILIGIPIGLAPFGATILGLVAISDIRHSRGWLTGLPLAFADAALFPTLLLNVAALAAVYFLFEQGSPRELRAVAVAVAALGCVLVDMIVLRRCWRAASRLPGQDAGAEASAGASDRSAALSIQPPLAHVDFTIRDAGDFDNAVTFHFSGFGYRLVGQRPNEWVFERGRSSAALFETDIRRYATTLVVRTAPVGDRGLRVSCRWTVKTYGALLFRSDISTLEAEGHSLRSLLSPDDDSSGFSAGVGSSPPQPANLSDKPEAGPPPGVSRGGRDWVTLTREQVEDDDLPDVCIVCGAPTQERVSRNFEHTPDWAGLLLLFGLFPGLIAIGLTQRTMRIACPVCPADRGHWSRLVWVSSVGWLVAVPLAALGYLIVVPLGGPEDARLAGALVSAGIGLILWLVPVIYLSSTRVSAKSITDDRITLQGVSPAFARAVSVHRTRATVDREPSTAGRIG